jgi:cell division septum initiation protein DivIVA
MPSQFRLRLFGYDRKQVNGFLSEKSSEYEEALAARQERLISMRDKNSALTTDLDRYRHMEADISAALITAREKASELITQSTREALRERGRLEEQIYGLERLTLDLFSDMETTLLTYEKQLETIKAEMEQRMRLNRERLEAIVGQREAFLRDSFKLLDSQQAV